MPMKQKINIERRKEIFYAALDAAESFRMSFGLRVEDVYGSFRAYFTKPQKTAFIEYFEEV